MALNKISFLKFLELALAITCIGLHLHSFGPSDSTQQLVVSGTFGGFLVILIGVFTGIFIGQPMGKRVDIFFSLAGCALFVASGALSIKYYENYYHKETKDIGLAKGAMAIINGAAFIVDALLTFRE